MEYKGLEKYKKYIEEKTRKTAEREEKKKAAERAIQKEETHQRKLKRRREAYKPIHLKKVRRRQNQRAYAKRRRVELAQHKKMGDVYGFYRIILTKNHIQFDELSNSWWMLTAYRKFNEYVQENREGVICEKRMTQSGATGDEEVKYEILLLKRIEEGANGVRELRNEEGMFIENKIANNDRYAIISKTDWYIPETYNVYGYNPITDRKTGRWIFDNIINKDCCRENLKNVFMCDNKLVVQYNSGFDFILCKNPDECLRLYNGLEQATGKKNKFVLYSGYLVEARKSWFYNEMEKKTGWDREKIYRKKN